MMSKNIKWQRWELESPVPNEGFILLPQLVSSGTEWELPFVSVRDLGKSREQERENKEEKEEQKDGGMK